MGKSWSLQRLHPSGPERKILAKGNELWAMKSLYSLAFFILSLLGSPEAKGVSYSLATEIRWTTYKILLCKFGLFFEGFSFWYWVVFYAPIFVFRLLATFFKPLCPALLVSGWDSRDCYPSRTLSFYGTTAASRPGTWEKNCNNNVKVDGIFVYKPILKNLYFCDSPLKQACAMLKYREQN